MESIRDYLRKGISQAGSLNKLAGAIKTASPNITRILQGSGFPGDDVVIRLADYLSENREKLLLINQAERAPEGARGEWNTIVKKFAGAAAIAFIVSTVLTALPCLAGGAESMYIMSNILLGTLTLLIFSPPPADTIPI